MSPDGRAVEPSPRAGRSKGRGYATGRATKAQILESAHRVFAETGYASGSLREIARRCGLSHATLLHHYPTKADLLIAVLARRDESMAQALAWKGDLDDLLSDMIEGARRNDSEPGLLRLFTLVAAEAADPEHPAHDYFTLRTATFVDDVGAMIARSQDAGTLPDTWAPRALALNILALWDGLQIAVPLAPPPVTVAEQLRLSFEVLLGRPLRG